MLKNKHTQTLLVVMKMYFLIDQTYFIFACFWEETVQGQFQYSNKTSKYSKNRPTNLLTILSND